MADNVTITTGADATIATDDVGGVQYQRIKLAQGADGAATDVSSAAPLQVTVANTGANATAIKVDASSVAVPITDNSGSLTVDYATTGSGTATGALRVELANNGTGVIATVGAVTAISNALPAGTNAIGKLAANSGVDIGDVDVTSVPTDPFGANADAASATGSISAKLRFIASTGIPVTGTVTVGSHAVTVASGGIASGAVASGAVASGAFASGSIASGAIASGAIAAGAIAAGATSIAENEDVASADGDRGVKILFKRLDTPANSSGTDGDYEQPQMSAGRVWTSTAIPSGGVASGAFASGSIASGAIASGAIAAGAIAAGATSIADNEDVASADGDRGVKILFKRTDTPANSSGTDGDYEQPQMSAGKLWVKNVGTFATVTTQVTRPADTNAYTANDALSDSTSAPVSGGFTLTGCGRISGGSGIITDAMFGMSTAAGTSLQGECWIFDTSVTNINDNAAFSISDSDRDKVVAIIPFTTSSSGSLNASAHVTGLNIGFTCVSSANLRFLIKVINAYTPASAEVLTVRVKCLQID